MTRKDIIALPNEALRKRSTRVKYIDKTIKTLAQDMKDATLDWEDHRAHEFGVALAAVQINQHKRVVVVRNNFDDKTDRSFTVFINPEIVKSEGGLVDDFEGCLSVKDVYGKVPRHKKVKIKALDLDGREFRVTAEDFLARVFQHEVDHTHGKLFIDHIENDEDAFFKLSSAGKLVKADYEEIQQTNIFRN